MSSRRPQCSSTSSRRLLVLAGLALIVFAGFLVGTRWRRTQARLDESTKVEARQSGATLERASTEKISSSPPRKTGRSQVTARMIEEKYRLPVLWKDLQFPVKTYHGSISAASAGAADIDDYCDLLIQEFMLYPLGVIQRSRLERIVLCRDLAFNGQQRAAVPDFEHSTLYLDVVRGTYDRNYQRHVIHHEFFHIIDYQDDGELYSDPRWCAVECRDVPVRARRGSDAG